MVTLVGAKNLPTMLDNSVGNLDGLKSPRHTMAGSNFNNNRGGSTPSVHSSSFSQKGMGFGGGRNGGTRRDTSIIGKTVRILQGPMKGYLGIARDATDSTVRVELHAQPKVKYYLNVLLNVLFRLSMSIDHVLAL
jgi:hypothetical protein